MSHTEHEGENHISIRLCANLTTHLVYVQQYIKVEPWIFSLMSFSLRQEAFFFFLWGEYGTYSYINFDMFVLGKIHRKSL